MTKSLRRGAILSAICLILCVCIIVPSVRGVLTSIAQQIMGRTVRYFNDELQNDGIDDNNYNFGFDRYAAAQADVKAKKVKSVKNWVAKSDGTGDFFYSISVDPALCAAVALHMDEKLALPETILRDEQNVLIGQRADQAHLHFLRDQNYWDRAVTLITQYLTSGKISVEEITKNPESQMYMWHNGLEGNKPSVIVRATRTGQGHVVVFDLGKPGTVKFRLECGYQPVEVGYWPTPVNPPVDPPEPTPTLEPKPTDAGPQGQMQQHPQPGYEEFGGGQNHDNDETESEEPQSPATYKPPKAPRATATPTPRPTQVPPDGRDHGDLSQIQEQQHSHDTVEESVHGDGVNEGDLDEGAVE